MSIINRYLVWRSLRNRLLEAKYMYYREGESLFPDHQYDQLEKRLFKLEGELYSKSPFTVPLGDKFENIVGSPLVDVPDFHNVVAYVKCQSDGGKPPQYRNALIKLMREEKDDYATWWYNKNFISIIKEAMK